MKVGINLMKQSKMTIDRRFCLICSAELSRPGKFCSKTCDETARRDGVYDCRSCGMRMTARPQEKTWDFLDRKFCSKECIVKAREGEVRFHHPSAMGGVILGLVLSPIEFPPDCFRDDPRAIRNLGTPGRLGSPESDRSLTGSTAALAVRASA